MRNPPPLLLAVAVLSSCGPPTVDDQVLNAKLVCLTKAGELFPDLKAVTDGEPWVDPIGNGSTGNEHEGRSERLLPGEGFRFVTTGKFIYDVPSAALSNAGPLTCTGDFNRKMIETINHNGLDKRPATGKVWSIE